MASSCARSAGSASHATIAPPASARISAVSAKKSFSRSSIAVSVRPKKLRLHHGEQWLSLALLAPAGRWEGGANLSCAAAWCGRRAARGTLLAAARIRAGADREEFHAIEDIYAGGRGGFGAGGMHGEGRSEEHKSELQ